MLRERFIAILIIIIPLLGYSDDKSINESQVKAGMLLNFARFTIWNNDQDTDKFLLTIYKNDELSKLKDDFEKLKVNGKPVQVRTITSIDAIKSPHLLFIGDIKSAEMEKVIFKVQGKGVLTISEEKNFLAKQGIILIRKFRKKFAFEVNLKKARKEDLLIRSNLLRLAKKVIQ